ncbi:MAG: dephospho-CoA kinase [Treponema sp.]|jgi:dephospho-CoA kinase|nr:dephospho-CoA kinase [Treponema sp.]
MITVNPCGGKAGQYKRGKIIGLTGMYCAGKNHVARLLEKRGIPALDVDKLGHAALEQERDAILRRFGPGVLGDGGVIDRKKLGALVFGKSRELAALEAIVHPAANRLTEQWINEREGQNLVINAALLHRSSVFERLDAIILVTAPWFARLIRARRRDHLPWREIFRRFYSQRDFMSQYLRKNTDIHIVGNGPFGKPDRRLDDILERICPD